MGAHVALIGRDRARLDDALQALDGDGHLALARDISVLEEIEPLVAETTERLGLIDGFIHSAGVELVLPLKLMTPIHFTRIYTVNVFAGFEFARQIAKKKYRNNQEVSLVFIASVAGIKAEAAKIGYSSSKAALINGVRSLALELASCKIRANSVSPAVCLTRMSLSFLDKLSDEGRKEVISRHPLGLGTPEDVAFACVYLLSNASRWVTGSNLVIDGGYSVH